MAAGDASYYGTAVVASPIQQLGIDLGLFKATELRVDGKAEP
ncbi:hypothetical protein [Streptomyces sp. NRRL F-5122]|nr:hypothetical protein [Streptomyces sp. NRRL F-5122]